MVEISYDQGHCSSKYPTSRLSFGSLEFAWCPGCRLLKVWCACSLSRWRLELLDSGNGEPSHQYYDQDCVEDRLWM